MAGGPLKHDFPLRKTALLLCALLLFVPVVLAAWPVDILVIADSTNQQNGKKPILRASSLLGRDITASIIHSVQLTPVIDIYRVQEGRLWVWEEKIQSHNAGLPFAKPARGRFLYDSPWIIVQGASRPVAPLYYRVGTEQLGKNVLCAFALPCMELWRDFPGKRLVFHVIRGTL